MQALLNLRRVPFVLGRNGVRAASDLGTHRVRSPKVHPEVNVAGFKVTAPYARVTEQSVSVGVGWGPPLHFQVLHSPSLTPPPPTA